MNPLLLWFVEQLQDGPRHGDDSNGEGSFDVGGEGRRVKRRWNDLLLVVIFEFPWLDDSQLEHQRRHAGTTKLAEILATHYRFGLGNFRVYRQRHSRYSHSVSLWLRTVSP